MKARELFQSIARSGSRPALGAALAVVLAGLALLLVGASLTVAAPVAAPARQAGSTPLTPAWSSNELDATYSVAWGDYDGDGDLDLAVGNRDQPNRLYRNDGGVLALAWTAPITEATYSVAWGDYDGDGDLDLAVGNASSHPNRLYLNDSPLTGLGQAALTLAWSSAETDSTFCVAWGDYDGDGDLDLAAGNYGQPNRLYRNEGLVGGTPQLLLVWSSAITNTTSSLAWGDVDGDGDLDLAVGNMYQYIQLYHNNGGTLTSNAVYTSADYAATNSLAWGDVDGDGDLDLAVGNGCDMFNCYPNRLYRNDGGALTSHAVYSTTETDPTTSVAWGDYDGDGDLDLLAGNTGRPNRLYRNDGGALTPGAAWSSDVADRTNSVAWGDYDGDGDLDLAVGNGNPSLGAQPNRLYRNDGQTLSPSAVYSTTEYNNANSVAWGDYDGDGDLDLAVGNGCNIMECYPSRLYRNNNGTLTGRAVYSTPQIAETTDVAWGDYDGDGDLDLAIGNSYRPNRLYRNVGGATLLTLAWSPVITDDTRSVAWGDYDGDGNLDLAVGNYGQPKRLYRNAGVTLATSPTWSSAATEKTTSVAWGDYDGDGDLDLAVGNDDQPNQLYRNDAGTLATTPSWSSLEADATTSVAWGDYDGDGDLDLAVGNSNQPNRLYRNDGGTLTAAAVWQSVEFDDTQGVAWGDYDGDGDLDLAVGNESKQSSRIYRNDDGGLTTFAVWAPDETTWARDVAWGDIDSDGDLDLMVSDSFKPRLYRNLRDGRANPGSIPTIQVARPGPNADFYSTPHIETSLTVPVTYTLMDSKGTPVKFIRAWYSPDGGGHWLPAVAASGTPSANLATTATYVYNWDVFASGLLGQSDNVVFRIQAVPAIVNHPDQTPGPYQYGSYASQTFPFRVRGTQVRVISGTLAVPDALVYRLPAGQTSGGALIADSTGIPFHTDGQGYLQGRGQVETGDRLLALVPITWTQSYTLYYTSGEPTAVGVNAHQVAAPGVQTLTVSAAHPLVLFHLDVSLEWDAHNDPLYLEGLGFNLQRASEYLYDFTDGQIALGRVNVFQNGDEWVYSHIAVNANNRIRPFAAQGGIVLTDTIDPQHNSPSDTIRYTPGQVSIGSTWNRYGNPGQSLGDDWPIILAHELGHYLLFHDDTYIGLNPNGFLIPITTCVGSAMGDLYDKPDNSEFIASAAAWNAGCANTLANQTLGRTEWQTMRLWYPGLVAPVAPNAGPLAMPFDFTAVLLHPPYTPTNTLADPTFYIDYQNGASSSSEARAYLLRHQYVYNLGSPFGGQNRLIARGAQPGDRLCVFDRPLAQFGCETIEPGDDRLTMRQDAGWNPIVQIRPINTTTLIIAVANPAPIASPLRARLFPDLGHAPDSIPLALAGGIYSGTFSLEYAALSGNVQVWADEAASENNPRRETIVAYSIGGNPGLTRGSGGLTRGSGGLTRGSGGLTRGSGGLTRGSGAPVISPDGQMIFFTENPADLITGTLFAIQGMTGLPALPPGHTLVGQGYNLVASPGAALPSGSVSIQYLSNDVLVAGADEANLGLYFWNGADWTALNTTLNAYFNFASAPAQGQGMYALMASVKIPLYGPGWNMVAYPLYASQPVSHALRSIEGAYGLVYGYEAQDATDPWKMYAPSAPSYANDLHELEFGRGYWISATHCITLHLANTTAASQQISQPLPPSTFYGPLNAGDGLTPTSGMALSAWIDGHLCGQAKTLVFGGQIVYTVNVLADDAGPGAGCGAPGKQITFRMGDYTLAPIAVWDNNHVQELALSRAVWRVYLPLIVKQ